MNNDRIISEADVLPIIEYLNAHSGVDGKYNSATPPLYSYDTSGDGYVSAIDALLVINQLNSASNDNSKDKSAVVSHRFTYTDGTEPVPVGQTIKIRKGLLKSETTPEGTRTEYVYYDKVTVASNFGRLKSVTYAVGLPEQVTHEFKYDNCGTLIEDKNKEMGTVNRMSYDRLNRMTGEWTDLDSASPLTIVSTTESGETKYEYNRRSPIKNITRVNDPVNLNHVITFTYDSQARLWTQTEGSLTTRYEYDPAGNLQVVTEPNGAKTYYRYNIVDQLDAVIYPDKDLTIQVTVHGLCP